MLSSDYNQGNYFLRIVDNFFDIAPNSATFHWNHGELAHDNRLLRQSERSDSELFSQPGRNEPIGRNQARSVATGHAARLVANPDGRVPRTIESGVVWNRDKFFSRWILRLNDQDPF